MPWKGPFWNRRYVVSHYISDEQRAADKKWCEENLPKRFTHSSHLTYVPNHPWWHEYARKLEFGEEITDEFMAKMPVDKPKYTPAPKETETPAVESRPFVRKAPCPPESDFQIGPRGGKYRVRYGKNGPYRQYF